MSDQHSPFGREELPVMDDDAASRSGLVDPALAYNYFKSMVSVSVATLGGILTLGETVFGARITPLQVGLAAAPVAIAGMLALQGQTDVMQLCLRIKPPLNSSRWALRLFPSLYGLGIGVFLAFLALSYGTPQRSARTGAPDLPHESVGPSAPRNEEQQAR